MRSRGFTLVELVMVIAITGIIAAIVTIFLKRTVDGYFDAGRRAGLTDMADTALRRMGRDVRSAVPNSIRRPTDQCFELLPSSTGGRYRMGPDIVNDNAPGCVPSATCAAPLDITQPVTTFDTLSPLSTTPAIGDWVVIDNQNPNDAYGAGVNRGAITAVGASPLAAFGTARISVTAGTVFPNGYDGGRFVVVPNNGGNPAVFYVCDGAGISGGTGTGTLYRVVRPFTAAYPAACPGVAGAAILASHVSSCTFVYDPSHGATQQSGFVWLQLELTEANETISLSHGAHVENVP